jgi:hypothetical protein
LNAQQQIANAVKHRTREPQARLEIPSISRRSYIIDKNGYLRFEQSVDLGLHRHGCRFRA